jgi:DUF1680 family protein
VVVEQETSYPAGDTSRLRVTKAGNGRFDLKVRIPAWTQGARLTVNGRAQAVQPGTHATISRRWAAGDLIEVTIPQPLRTLPIDDKNPDLAALLRGPVMYVGLNPWEGLETQKLPLPSGLQRLPGDQQAYSLPVGSKTLVFLPYYRVELERYNTYFRTA